MVNKILKYLSNISIRRMIAMLLTLLFSYLSIKGKIESEQVTAIYGVIIGFYFGKSTALEMPTSYKGSKESVEE